MQFVLYKFHHSISLTQKQQRGKNLSVSNQHFEPLPAAFLALMQQLEQQSSCPLLRFPQQDRLCKAQHYTPAGSTPLGCCPHRSVGGPWVCSLLTGLLGFVACSQLTGQLGQVKSQKARKQRGCHAWMCEPFLDAPFFCRGLLRQPRRVKPFCTFVVWQVGNG